MSEPKVVFCTTCKGRAQHLEQTLPKNLADNPGPNVVFVVVDYCSQDHLATYMRENHGPDMKSGRVVFYQYKTEHPFQMAHAKNMAHRLGIREGADILVNLDADNYTEPGFAKYIVSVLSQDSDRFLWSNMIKGVLDKGISGRIAVTRHQFLCIGGYDEIYKTYGPDDKDFKARLLRLGYKPCEVPPKFLKAVRHNDKMRFREYPEVQGKAAEDFYINQKNRVRNYGNIGCGTVWRNFDPKPIELKPIPTRIFGIGMHKTATTSLHHALQMLGFQSGHWKNAHWAKKIWREMNEEGSSRTLETSYALSDIPIPQLIKKLDSAYPGSKFILTLRDEDAWLSSVKKHFDPNHNPQQKFWDCDPFTHIIHQKIYGQTTFDEEVFREAYRRHNLMVMEYFRDRPEDLVVLNMSSGGRWEDLCSFLEVPIPQEEYPKKNGSPKVPIEEPTPGIWQRIWNWLREKNQWFWRNVIKLIEWLFGI